MAEFREIDPMLAKEGNANDRDDENDGNTTGHLTFNPYYNSTPGSSGDQYEMTATNREGEKTPETAKKSFIDGDSLEKSRITMANLQLEGKFPEYSKSKSTKLNCRQRPIQRESFCCWSSRRKYLFVQFRRSYKSKPSLRNFLGPSRGELMAEQEEEIEEKQKSIRENQEIADDENEHRATRG